MTELRPTAVAVIDALGFKGIWKQHKPADVLKAMGAIRKFAESVNGNWLPELHETRKVVATFSDTVVIGVQPSSEGSTTSPEALIHQLALSVTTLLSCALKTIPPIPYRGCVAFGECSIETDSFIGPAIDEAAEWSEAAEAAIVWLCPSAVEAIATEGPQRGLLEELMLFPWPVPVKGGGVLDTYAVNPLSWVKFPGVPNGPTVFEDAPTFRSSALARFRESTDVRVAIKRQNTERFLDAAEAYSIDWWQRFPMRPSKKRHSDRGRRTRRRT